MSLIIKRLKQVAIGETVEIKTIDGVVFSGVLSDKDEDAIVIQNENDEMVIPYEEIRLYKKGVSSNSTNTVNSNATVSEPIVKIEKTFSFSFSKDEIAEKTIDEDINKTFKIIPKNEKSCFNGFVVSLNSAVKNNDREKIVTVAKNVKKFIYDYEDSDYLQDSCFRLASLILYRAKMYNEDFAVKGKCYHLIAFMLYKDGQHEKAAAYATLSLLEEVNNLYKDEMYTIIANGLFKLNDSGAIIYVLENNPFLRTDVQLNEILRKLYTNNGKKYNSSLMSKTKLIEDIKQMVPRQNIASIIKSELASSSSTGKTGGLSRSSDEVLRGQIINLSWGVEKGIILADEVEYEFSYLDVTDKKLSNKLQSIYCRDLRAQNILLYVKFKLVGGTVKNVVYDKPVVVEKPEELSYIQQARKINADAQNENRFHQSLELFEKAIECGEDIGQCITGTVFSCMAIANKEKDEEYLDRAFNLYLAHKDELNGIGLQNNSTLLDLFIKMGKVEESMTCLSKILADPLLSVQTRMQFIGRRADLLYEEAEKSGDAEQYHNAMSGYQEWEQQYFSSQEVRENSNFEKHYNTYIKCRIAICLYKTGDFEKTEQTVLSILALYPTNVMALELYDKVKPKQDESDEQTESAEDYIDTEQEEEIEIEPKLPINYEYIDVSGWKALDMSFSDVMQYVLEIKGDSRIPLALTYLKAANMLDSSFDAIYKDLSYATDNPMETLDYNLANILTFDTELSGIPELSRFCLIASYIRGSFYYTSEDVYYEGAEYLNKDCLNKIPSLSEAISVIDGFRMSRGKGIDYYADYRTLNIESTEKLHDAIKKDAVDVYDSCFLRKFHESKSQKRFKLTKALIFEKDGLPEKLVTCVKNDKYENFDELREDFCEAYIRKGMVISSKNIDGTKIDAAIESAWKRAGDDKSVHARKTSDLMGTLFNNIRSMLTRCVKLVCDWVELCENRKDNRGTSDYKEYKDAKANLIPLLKEVVEECKDNSADTDEQTEFCLNIISELACELISRLDGTWNSNRKYYFCDLLRTDNVLLDENFIPDLTSSLCDLEDFNILARIRNHIESTDATIVEHANMIFSRDERNHDFGTAKLIDEYLKATEQSDLWTMPENVDEFDSQAVKKLNAEFEKFNSDICMAISRGQIDVSDSFLNSIEDTTQYWNQYCLLSHNYGFFVRLVDSCMKKVKDTAASYERILLKRLNKIAEEEHLKQDTIDTVTDFINKQYFTVAEDWMSRIYKGDFDSELKPPIDVNKYLETFWSEFEENYSIVSRFDNALRNVVSNKSLASKDRKGGDFLINNWIKNNVKSEQIGRLLNLLGWDDINVIKVDNAKYTIYNVKYTKSPFRKTIFSHPIPAFGTKAYNDVGFYVVCVFGYIDSDRLIDLYQELEYIHGNKIILLDYALNAAERRKLAKKIKQVPLAYTYLLIDRVTIMYIANHYVSGGNSKTLMAITMPFSYLQPYVTESASKIPPEMFIGRRSELLSIESPTGANLVFGGRQLGKTALLKKAKEETDDRSSGRIALFVDIYELNMKEAALKVSEELFSNGIISEEEKTDDWGKLASAIKSGICSKSINYLLLMLDETDKFIDDCKDAGYKPLAELKGIQQDLPDRFKFVIAGLMDIVRFNRAAALSNNSVIPHFTSINIKPFDYDDGKELLTKPLIYLGFTFEGNDEIISHILSTTNYFPGLIQLYCKKLIESMKKNYGKYDESTTPLYHITEEHIAAILADKDFVNQIKNRFEMTISLDKRYYITVLLLAYLFLEEERVDGFVASEIHKKSFELLGVNMLTHLSDEQVTNFLEELCDLNILVRSKGGMFSFRTKSFRDLLGSKSDIEDKLLEIMNKSTEEGDCQ